MRKCRLDCGHNSGDDETTMSSANPPLELPFADSSACGTQLSAMKEGRGVLDRIIFAGLMVWTFLTLCFPLYDTDFWWHLKTGEWILQERRVPQVDLFTFSSVGRPWIDLHWGFQVFITLLYRLGGVDLVILAKAAVTTAAVAVAWFAGGDRLPVWAKALVWILPSMCVSARGYERPEMLSLLFLAAWLWLARHVEERPRMIWFLPLVQVVWVNCHALFVLGLVVGGCYVADCVARDVARGRWGLTLPAANPPGPTLLWVGFFVVAACFINPYFEEGALFPLTLYRKFSDEQEIYSKSVLEFRPPIYFLQMGGGKALTNPYLLAEFLVWCLTAGSFVWLYWRRREWSVLRLLLFVAFSHLAWKATRNANIFGLVSGFVACENLGGAAELGAQSYERRPGRAGAWSMAAVVAGLIVSVLTGWWNEFGQLDRPFGLGETPGWYIHGAARYAGGAGFPNRAFVAHNGQAGVYIYHNAPERFVYIDGRLEVCTSQTFQTYRNILEQMANANPGWQGVFRDSRQEMPVVILDATTPTSIFPIRGMLHMPGWRPVYADEMAVVFLTDQQADRLSQPKVDLPLRLDRWLREVEANTVPESR